MNLRVLHCRIQHLACLLLCGFAIGATAQSSTAPQVEARRNFTFASEDLMLPAFAPESEADDDLGVQLILEPISDYDPFTVMAYTGYAYTTNADLAEEDTRDDHLWLASVAASWLPVLKGNLYGEVTARSNHYRYNSLQELDFDSVEAGAGLIYVIRQLGDVSSFVRYNYTDLEGSDGIITDFYTNHALETGLYKSRIVTRNQHLFLSYRSEISFDADPGFAKRDEHGFIVGYRIVPRPKVKAEFFSRVAYLDYEEEDREDWNSSTGVALTYNFTPHMYLSGHASWTANSSNLAFGGDYETWITGIRVGGYWQF